MKIGRAQVGIAGVVATALGAYIALRIGVEKGAQAAADAIDHMDPAAFAVWKAGNAGKAHAAVPMIPLLGSR